MAESATPVAEAQSSAPPGWRVKVKKSKQRTCDEKDDKATLPAKSKVCCGHLKRWYDYPADAEAAARKLIAEQGWKLPAGRKPEIYRCENCKTLYVNDPAEISRSYTLRS